MGQSKHCSAPQVLREHAERLAGLPVDSLDETGVIDLVRANERAIRVLEGIGTTAAVRLAELGGLSAEDVFSTAGKHSTAQARRISRRGSLAEAMPAVTSGFMDGSVATTNVDAVATARHRLRHQPQWVSSFDERDCSIARKAARMSPKRFGTWLRQLTDGISDDGETDQRSEEDKNSFRSWTNADGRWQARLDLDALSGEMVQNAIDAEARSLAKQQSDAGETVHHGEHLNSSALSSLLQSANATKGRPSIHVVVDRDTLTRGLWDGTIKRTGAGNDLPVSHIRQMLCDAWITHTVLGPSGRALAVGRSHRTATDAQRSALRVMYPTCAMCEVRFDHCEMHHIIEWEHGGLTDLDNLIPLCAVHHERVHKGWRIELSDNRNLQVDRPDGRQWKTTQLPSAAPTWARNQHRKRHERIRTTIK